MQTAPPLIVSSLSAPYRLLAEFNCIVLGGMRTEFGTQFATWAHRGDGLLFGHYCDNDYGAAKQDFVIRAGLIETVRYCLKETLECGNRSFEDENEIEALCGKIAQVLPEPPAKSEEACLALMNQTM